MTGIVIVVHAPLGTAMRESVRHVLGDTTDVLAVHDILPEDLPDDLVPQVLQDILRVNKGQGVLVLTDLIGATPANIAKRAVADAQASGVQCCVLAGPEYAHVAARPDIPQFVIGRNTGKGIGGRGARLLACRLMRGLP